MLTVVHSAGNTPVGSVLPAEHSKVIAYPRRGREGGREGGRGGGGEGGRGGGGGEGGREGGKGEGGRGGGREGGLLCVFTCCAPSCAFRDRMNLKCPIYFSTGLTEKV